MKRKILLPTDFSKNAWITITYALELYKKHAFFGSILTQPLVKVKGYNSKVPLLVLHDLRN